MYTEADAIEDGWEPAARARAFTQWRQKLDRIVEARLHLGVDDLPDWDFASSFEAGETPSEAAEQFIQDTLLDFGLDPHFI